MRPMLAVTRGVTMAAALTKPMDANKESRIHAVTWDLFR